jgi:hypothetical protein
MVATDREGNIFKNGFPAGKILSGPLASQCGRYAMKMTEGADYLNPMIDVRAIEDLKPLFRIEGVAALNPDLDGEFFSCALLKTMPASWSSRVTASSCS